MPTDNPAPYPFAYEHPYPFAYYRGRAITFARNHRFGCSYFGGPGDFSISGKNFGPGHIHHIATITTKDLGIEDHGLGSSVPFYYGMCFDGCDLTYTRLAHSAIDITAIEPNKGSPDWPYSGFPPLFPYIPLKVEETKELPFEDFSESVMQGLGSLDDDTLVLIVPPNPLIGVSMWGPLGDAERVQIVFVYNTLNGTMHAYNACT